MRHVRFDKSEHDRGCRQDSVALTFVAVETPAWSLITDCSDQTSYKLQVSYNIGIGIGSKGHHFSSHAKVPKLLELQDRYGKGSEWTRTLTAREQASLFLHLYVLLVLVLELGTWTIVVTLQLQTDIV